MNSLNQYLSSNVDLVNPKYKSQVYSSFLAVGVAIGALYAPWESVKIVGLTVLSGTSYCIASHLIGCRDCIEYYTTRSVSPGNSFKYCIIKTLDPNLTAIVWGAGSYKISAVVGLIFAFIARAPIPGLPLKITAAQLAPCFAIGAAIIFFVSHYISRLTEQEMSEFQDVKYLNVPDDRQAKWGACEVRVITSTMGFLSASATLSIGIVAARMGLL